MKKWEKSKGRVTEKAPIEMPEERGKYVYKPFTLYSHILIMRMVFMKMRIG
jgi:hypothetical protein